MNKDIINKYKKEFDAWLDGETVEVDAPTIGLTDISEDCEWCFNDTAKIRIKPKTRMIGDIECPMPLKHGDYKNFSKVYSPCFTDLHSSDWFFEHTVRGSTHIYFEGDVGMLFDNSKDAATTAKALLKLIQI